RHVTCRPPKPLNRATVSRAARSLRFLIRSRYWFRFGAGLRRQRARQFVRFSKPVGDGRLYLVSVSDLNDVNDLGFRCAIDAAHLWRVQLAAKKHAEFEKLPFRPHKEVARLAREHDRFMGSVDPLISKRDGSLAEPFPSVLEIFREILG